MRTGTSGVSPVAGGAGRSRVSWVDGWVARDGSGLPPEPKSKPSDDAGSETEADMRHNPVQHDLQPSMAIYEHRYRSANPPAARPHLLHRRPQPLPTTACVQTAVYLRIDPPAARGLGIRAQR